MSSPLVSIIIPAFNCEATIRRAVESTLAQTCRAVEVIVVDDGSTDGTASALDKYGSSIRFVRQSNAGPSAARNHGVRESRGEIVAFLDADDVWLPEKIERQVAMLGAGGARVVCCVCNAELREADGTIGSSFQRAGIASPAAFWLNPGEVLTTRFLLFNQVVAIRRAAFEAVGGFNESFRLLEDYDLAMRLAPLGPWGILPEPLVVKYNDTAGIGVRAMQDAAVHLAATRQVVEHLLEHTYTAPDVVRTLLLRALRDVKTQAKAQARLTAPSPISRFMGRLGLGALRGRKAVRRRLPSWPVIKTRASLEPPFTLPALSSSVAE